jgi:hypothetical protein
VPAPSFNYLSDGLPRAGRDGTPPPPLAAPHDSGRNLWSSQEKIAEPSQVFLNQGTRNNPLAIRLRKLRPPDGRISRTRHAKKKRSGFN